MIAFIFTAPDGRTWKWRTHPVLVGDERKVKAVVAPTFLQQLVRMLTKASTHEARQIDRIRERCERALRQGTVGCLADFTVGDASNLSMGRDKDTAFTCNVTWEPS